MTSYNQYFIVYLVPLLNLVRTHEIRRHHYLLMTFYNQYFSMYAVPLLLSSTKNDRTGNPSSISFLILKNEACFNKSTKPCQASETTLQCLRQVPAAPVVPAAPAVSRLRRPSTSTICTVPCSSLLVPLFSWGTQRSTTQTLLVERGRQGCTVRT